MNTQQHFTNQLNRRSFLNGVSVGIGSLALTSMLGPRGLAKASPLASGGAVNPLHFAPEPKRVIHLCMAGGPSHLETLDYKPKLAEMNGKGMPKSITDGQPIAQLQGNKALKCLGPQHEFEKYGKSGQSISKALPHIGGIADDICIVRSMTTQQINHDPAHTFMNTGADLRPAEHGVVGAVRVGQRRRPCRATSCCPPMEVDRISRSPLASGTAASFRAVTRACTFTRPATRCSTSATRSEQQGQGEVINAVNALNKLRNKAVADPEIERALANTRWPSACRPACRS